MEDLLTTLFSSESQNDDEETFWDLDAFPIEPIPFEDFEKNEIDLKTISPTKKTSPPRKRSRSSSKTNSTNTTKKKKQKSHDPLLPPNLKDLSSEEKKRLRLLRNRRSAQLHRDRKKKYVANLEKRVKELEEENQRLKHEVKCLRNELSKSSVDEGELFREIGPFEVEENEDEESPYSSDDQVSSSPPQSPHGTFVAFAFVFCFLLFGGSMFNDVRGDSSTSISKLFITSSPHQPHLYTHSRALMSVPPSEAELTVEDYVDEDEEEVEEIVVEEEKQRDEDSRLKWALERYISKYVSLVRMSQRKSSSKAIALWRPVDYQDEEFRAATEILRSNGIPLILGTPNASPVMLSNTFLDTVNSSVVLCPRAHGFIQGDDSSGKNLRRTSNFFIRGQNLTLVVPGEDLHFGSWGKLRDSDALYEIGCKMESVRPISSKMMME